MPKKTASAIMFIVLLNVLPIFAFNTQPVKATYAEIANMAYYDLADVFSSLTVSGTVTLYDQYNLELNATTIGFTNTLIPNLTSYARGTGNWDNAVKSLKVDGTVTLYEDAYYQGRKITFTSSNLAYDNIGTEWNANPNLTRSDAWDRRLWTWGSNQEPNTFRGDANNYVNWTQDGLVVSNATCSGFADPWKAANFDQGFERNDDEIYNLGDYGWNDRARSLRVNGNVTLYEHVGYGGINITFGQDVDDLWGYSLDYGASSLKLDKGSCVTLYGMVNFSDGNGHKTFISPAYQPPDLKVSDKDTITLEGVVHDWYTYYDVHLPAIGWTGAKFDVFAVENRSDGNSKTLMLEMYFLRDGANLDWSWYNLHPLCPLGWSGSKQEGFRGPEIQSIYNYLVAVDEFPGIANRTIFPGNLARWTIDMKAFIQRACEHDWGPAPNLDINKLNIVKTSFTLEAANDLFGLSTYTAAVGCSLNRLRLAYTEPKRDIATVNISLSNRIVSPPLTEYVNVTVENRGNQTETTDAFVYANNVVIGNRSLTLPPFSSQMFTATWNTLGFAGEYVISAYAKPFQGEENTVNNRLIDGNVTVTGKGCFIIVAGNYEGDQSSAINYGCNQVFSILREVGYSGDDICYLSQPEFGNQDVDGDGKNDVDAWASNASLRWAIETWAIDRTSPSEPLFLYFFDHGSTDVFSIDYPDLVTSGQLATWFDHLEKTTRAPIYVIYAACRSGSFIDELSRTGRVVISSCQENESSYPVFGIWESFSIPFWNYIRSGHSIGSSFDFACSPYSLFGVLRRIMNLFPNHSQTPLLDDNGDKTGHTGPLPNGGDGYLAENIYIGASEWQFPWIMSAVPKQSFVYSSLPENTTLWAQVNNRTALANVTAWMLAPDWTPPNSTDTLVSLELEPYQMNDFDHDGNWTVNIPSVNFTSHTSGPGNFTFFLTAEEETGDMATPVIATIQFAETNQTLYDVGPPTVAIERPIDEQTVCGTIIINGTVLDDVCLDRVEIYVDGNYSGTVSLLPSSAAFFEFSLDTTVFENGRRTILVKTFDKTGNCGNQTLNVNVNNFRHDVAVTDVVLSRTIIYEGTALQLNVTVANHGSYLESFNCTLNANATCIASEHIILSVGNYSILSYHINTSALACGDYTLVALAECVPAETNTGDNAVSTSIILTIPGDIKGDFTVDIYDAILLSNAYNSRPGGPNWNAAADLNSDNIVDLYDAIILSNHFNQHYP